MARKDFVYSALDSATPDAFRFLSLRPGCFEEPIECTLAQERHCCPRQPYEALSYAWGNPALTVEISADESQFWITRNLEQALRHLRPKSGGAERILWIDAICIDQSNLLECNNQVGAMQQIYANAERVVIWLGERSEDSRMAIDFIKYVGTGFDKYEVGLMDIRNARRYQGKEFEQSMASLLHWRFLRKWIAVGRLLQQSWFESVLFPC